MEEKKMVLDKHYYNLYIKLNKEKSFALAEEALRKAIELNEISSYYYELAQLLKRQGRWWQVVDNLHQALSLNPSSTKKWKLDYIEALEKMNRFKEVVDVFDTLNKEDMTANEYFRYGCALESLNQKDKAKEAFQNAIKLDKEYQSDILGIGIFYEKRGKWIDSLRYYKEKAKDEPFNALLHYKVGLSYDRNYEWEKAQKSIAYAITLDNSKSYFFNRLAFTYERNRQFLEASEVYALAIHKDKNHKPYWYYRLGYSLSKCNKFQESCEAFLQMNKIAIEEEDTCTQIEQKIREKNMRELSSQLSLLFLNINDLTFKEELTKIIELGKSIHAWDIVEQAYKLLLLREYDLKHFISLGFALYKQEKYEEASHAFIKQRVLQDAHGVPEKKFDTDKWFNQVVTYAEYLKKETVLEQSIFYETDKILNENNEAYRLFLMLIENERFKNWKHIWVVPNNSELLEKYREVSNVIFINKNTKLYLKYLAISKYLINTTTFSSPFIKKKSQKYLTFIDDREENTLENSIKTQNLLQATHIINLTKKPKEELLISYNIQNISTANYLEKNKELNEEKIIDFLFFDNIKEAIKLEKEKNSILFFAPFEANGIGSSILNLLSVIDLNKYSVTVVLDSNDKRENIERVDKRVNIITRFGRMVVTLEEQWLRDKLALYKSLENEEMLSFYKEAFSREFIRMFGYHKFDTIIDFNGYRTFWTSLFAFGNAKQKNIYLHSDMYKEYILKYPSLGEIFFLYKYFDKLVSVSESSFKSNKKILAPLYNLSDEVFIFSNNPIDYNKYIDLSNKSLNSLEYKKFIEDKRTKFINVGRLSPEKGQLKLIESFAKICEKEKNIALYIIGDGTLYNKLIKKIKELDMQNHITLLGYQQNPYPFIKMADCMVLTSEHEGQSLVLLEALVLNTPCISTNIPGPRSVLEGGYGLLCGESIEEIIREIKKFLSNNIILKKFDSVNYNKDTLNSFYENLINKTEQNIIDNKKGLFDYFSINLKLNRIFS